MEKAKELIDLRNQVEDIDGTVFFNGEDENSIDEYKAKVIATNKQDKIDSYDRMRKQVIDRIYDPHGGPAQTLMELEDIAIGEGFDPDEIELILLNL